MLSLNARRLGPALALGVALLAAGCGGGGGDRAGSTTPATATPAAAKSTTPRAAADGTNVKACRDGSCEVRVDSGVEIPLAAKFGLRHVRFTFVDAGSAGFEGELADKQDFVTHCLGPKNDPKCGSVHVNPAVGAVPASLVVRATDYRITFPKLIAVITARPNGTILRLMPPS